MDCYIRLPVCSALYARNAQYARGPSSFTCSGGRLLQGGPYISATDGPGGGTNYFGGPSIS